MGRATRWLRGLLGGKKDGKGERKQPNGSTVAWDEEHPPPPPQPPLGREKKRRSFTRPGDYVDAKPAVSSTECSRRRVNEGCHRDKLLVRDSGDKNERSPASHALAVAAATVAAADAATAAAQAAAEVARLTATRSGDGRRRPERGTGSVASAPPMLRGYAAQWWAAVSIQTAFRGFLARKALRALRALVKLQGLVRGYLVRKQAAATLHCMEALIRAQVTVRMHRSGLLPASYETQHPKDNKYLSHHYPHPEITRPRRSLERVDDTTRSDHHAMGASFHSRRMSANLDHVSTGFDESPKIVEVDPGRPKPRNQLRAINVNPPPTEDYSTTEDTTQSRSSPLTVHTPPSSRLHVPPPTVDPIRVSPHDGTPEWELDPPRCHRGRFPATAHSTPRLQRTSPAKSACGWSDVDPLRWRSQQNAQHQHNDQLYHPRFMAGTQSSKAKTRSQSAPKQRPDPRRRLTLHEMVEARASLSGIRMQRSCSRAQEATGAAAAAAGFKGVSSTTAPGPRSCELGKGAYDSEFLDHLEHLHLQRRW